MKVRLSNIAGTLNRALCLIWNSDSRLAFKHLTLIILQSILPLISLLALKQIIDAATALLQAGALDGVALSHIPELYQSNSHVATLTLYSALGVICLSLNAFIRIATGWISEFHSIAITDEVYRRIHTTLVNADFAFFENPDDQNSLYLAREQAVSRPIRVIGGISQLLQNAIGIGGTLLILFSFAPLLPLLLCFSAIPALLLKLRRSRRFFIWRNALVPYERECEYFHSIMTANEGAKEIRLYGHASYCQKRFQSARDVLKERRHTWRKIVLKYDLTAMAASFLAAAVAFIWLLDRTMSGVMSAGTLVLCIQVLRRGQSGVANISNALASLMEDSIFLRSYEDLTNRTPLIGKPLKPQCVPTPLKNGITFENVSFCYQGAKQPALRNLSLTLKAGEKIVLAGANGAGKSTFIKLLCRLYDPDEGKIMIDGVDLKTLDPVEWRNKIGVLFQDFNTYQLSVEDNIRIGHPDFKSDDPAILNAANDAGLKSVIERWPDGIKTLLGRWLHDGIEPSTGQWQKIALARAFLRPAEIYLLDEPTSALDGAAQREALNSLRKLSGGKLTLFTSHRALPTKLADRVILLENGEVVADSTPEDIVKRSEFSQLFSV